MSIKTKEEILNKIRDLIGEDTSDESLAFVEDVSDTIDDYETKTKDGTDWKEKYETNDKEWRKKYRDRFFNSPAKDEETDGHPLEDTEEEANSKLTYDKLFKEDTK